jgi:hypothetical protein
MTIRNRLKGQVLIGFEGPRYSENHELRDLGGEREKLLSPDISPPGAARGMKL